MTQEPIHVLSLGAGVQSSAVALRAAQGLILPMPVAAVFADTQSEPDAVMTWLDWLEKQLPFPVIRVTAGSLAKKVTTPKRSKSGRVSTSSGIPAFIINSDNTIGMMPRPCTHDFKVAPVDKALTALMRKHHAKTCIKWLGISTDEIYRLKPSRRSTVTHRWPLIEQGMGRHDCLLWMKENGYPQPPRSACIFCPYRSNSEWRALSKSEFKKSVEFEQALQVANVNGTLIGKPFLHRSMKPLSEVDFSTEEDRGQLNMWNNECEGMCGT